MKIICNLRHQETGPLASVSSQLKAAVSSHPTFYNAIPNDLECETKWPLCTWKFRRLLLMSTRLEGSLSLYLVVGSFLKENDSRRPAMRLHLVSKALSQRDVASIQPQKLISSIHLANAVQVEEAMRFHFSYTTPNAQPAPMQPPAPRPTKRLVRSRLGLPSSGMPTPARSVHDYRPILVIPVPRSLFPQRERAEKLG